MISVTYTQSSVSLNLEDSRLHYTSFSDCETLSKIRALLSNNLQIEPSRIVESLHKIEKFMELARKSASKKTSQLYLDGLIYSAKIANKRKALMSEITDKLAPQIPAESFSDIFSFKEIYPGVICITSKSLLVLSFAFMRLSEHYESQSERFRNNVFSREEFKDWFGAENDGNFTYYDNWGGFNIPGHSFLSFLKAGFSDLLPIEKFLIEKISKHSTNRSEEFYIIGIDNSEDQSFLDHELAHAIYHLNSDYNSEINTVLSKIPVDQQDILNSLLTSYGYTKQVLMDETHAFLLQIDEYFEPLDWDKEGLNIEVLKPIHKEIAAIFARYRSAHERS